MSTSSTLVQSNICNVQPVDSQQREVCKYHVLGADQLPRASSNPVTNAQAAPAQMTRTTEPSAERPATCKSRWPVRLGSPVRCTTSRSSHFSSPKDPSSVCLKPEGRSMWTQTHPLDFQPASPVSPTAKPLATAGVDGAWRAGKPHNHMEAVHDVLEEFYNTLVIGKATPRKQHEPKRHTLHHKPKTITANIRTMPEPVQEFEMSF